METRALKFEVDGFGGGLESTRVGDFVEISLASLRVLGFDVRDATARSWTIAALRSSGLKGKTVAGLCFVSFGPSASMRSSGASSRPC